MGARRFVPVQTVCIFGRVSPGLDGATTFATECAIFGLLTIHGSPPSLRTVPSFNVVTIFADGTALIVWMVTRLHHRRCRITSPTSRHHHPPWSLASFEVQH